MIKVKKFPSVAAITLITAGITACNGDQGAMNTGNHTNNAQPMGYYSNENATADNEGPATEMLDGMHNDNNYFHRVNDRYTNKNMSNPTAPLGERDQGLMRDNRYSHGDANYHGHLNEVGYYNRGDGEMTRKVRNSVEKINGVEDAQVLVTEDTILVAIETNDQNNKKIRNKVTNNVQRMAEGRDIQVYTDEGTLKRLRNIDNDIQNGVDRQTIDGNINNLLNDKGEG